jgi:hypothetical protein
MLKFKHLSITNPKVSSNTYLSTIDPLESSSCAPHDTSISYEPHTSNSSTTCNNKCIIISKYVGKNYFSSKDKITTTSSFKLSMFKGFQTFTQTCLKTQHSFMMVIRASTSIRPHKHNLVTLVTSTYANHATSSIQVSYLPYV